MREIRDQENSEYGQFSRSLLLYGDSKFSDSQTSFSWKFLSTKSQTQMD